MENLNSLSSYELSLDELKNVEGGVAPLLIYAGYIAGAFALGVLAGYAANC